MFSNLWMGNKCASTYFSSALIAFYCCSLHMLALTIKIEHQFKPSGVSFFCCDASSVFLQHVTQYFQCASPSNIFLLSCLGR